MYWKTDCLDNPDWQREAVIARISRFKPGFAMKPGGPVEAYCRFYGLDLWCEHPELGYTIGFVSAGVHDVAVQHFSLPGARGTVLILHGYFDHAGLFSQLINHCLHAGLDVVVYDQPGHGLSTGAPASIKSFSEYQDVLAAIMSTLAGHAAEPWLAAGQSTGGGVLADYLLQQVPAGTCRFAHVVMLAPLVRPVGWGGIKLLHSLARPFVSTWSRMFSQNSGNARFLYFLREQDPLQARAIDVDWVSALRQWVPRMEAATPVHFPVTVIQGGRDMTVDWNHNLRVIRNKFSPVQEHHLAEARHHLVNDAPQLQATVFNTIIEAFRQATEVSPTACMAVS